MEKNDEIPLDERVTIGGALKTLKKSNKIIYPKETLDAAIIDYNKVITGGNHDVTDIIEPLEKKELTDKEKHNLKLQKLKDFIHRSAPKKEYGVEYKQKRQKKNKAAKQSRRKNR